MPKFASVKYDGVIDNIIISDSKELAEEVTGLLCIEYTDELVEVNGIWDGTRFYPPKPSENSVWSESLQKWVDGEQV